MLKNKTYEIQSLERYKMDERQSKIFTKTELEELNKRFEGQKKNYKIWYKAKFKINELLEIWFPKKKNLEKTIKEGSRNLKMRKMQ